MLLRTRFKVLWAQLSLDIEAQLTWGNQPKWYTEEEIPASEVNVLWQLMLWQMKLSAEELTAAGELFVYSKATRVAETLRRVLSNEYRIGLMPGPITPVSRVQAVLVRLDLRNRFMSPVPPPPVWGPRRVPSDLV